MPDSPRELWASFIAILVITALYGFVVLMTGSIPAASEFFGHSLGILGFSLMLITETLYSFRKRSRKASWGKMSTWLQFHIFTGLVGPYLVFLHSAWKFNGLAGVVLLLTIITVISGFVGRYIFTAIPRSTNGSVLEFQQLENHISRIEKELSDWLENHPQSDAAAYPLVLRPKPIENGWQLYFTAPFQEWYYRWQWYISFRLDSKRKRQAVELANLLKRQRIVYRQVHSMAYARRMLAIWHTIHIPIGLVLFTTAVVHIFAAIYYASLLH